MDPRNMAAYMAEILRGQSHAELIGPIADAGGENGLVLRGGELVEEWGDTERVDMCFSVAKSFLSAVAGLAFDRGLIADVHEPVVDGRISWHHLLQQTSQWEGTLWGKPTSCDPASEGVPLGSPGSAWGYNDVRVNLLALELLRRWRRPLPEVLRDELMDPIGASDTWRWHGYRNSYLTSDGQRMQSVSGGGHWGGGVWACTRDLARFGELYLRRGRWGDRRILSERWIDLSLTPCEHNPRYGYLWRLGDGTFHAQGGGGNRIFVDPAHDLVIVTRWVDDPDSLIASKRAPTG
jgi:CubicO group peptidase (beta-lactamase class C family)